MEKKKIELYRKQFDGIRHESDGIEYWYARELMIYYTKNIRFTETINCSL